MKLGSPEERKQALIIAAAIALHADISARGLPGVHDQNDCSAEGRIARAFNVAEKFMAEAERRLGP